MTPVLRAMIDDWLASHGGPRRFERGASNDFDAVRRYLERHGKQVTFSQNGFVKVQSGTGRPATLPVKSLFRIVDDLRVAEGLQPMRPPEALR